MFDKLDLLQEMSKKTNQISPSFCMAKWMHSTIHLDTGQTHSCYLPTLHKIPISELKKNVSALHNTHFKKKQRQMMLKGERPPECSTCWAIEDLPDNQISDRLMRSVDSWTLPYFDNVPKMNWKDNINPSYLEISFSKSCNMKCSYCSPAVSSAWAQEIKKLGAYKLSNHNFHNSIVKQKIKNFFFRKIDETIYLKAFWKWWPNLVKDLMFFRITGGEPLLSKNTFEILKWISNNPQIHLELSINSNLQVPQLVWNNFLNQINPIISQTKVKKFLLHTSIDSYGVQAEYIRNGLIFFSFENRIEEFLERNPTSSIAIMCTFNNLSIVGFRKLLDWVIMLRKKWRNNFRSIYIDLPHLQEPFHQSILILPSEYINILIDDLEYMKSRAAEGFVYQSEIIKMQRIIELMKFNININPQKTSTARKDFYLFFKEHDRRRGSSFLDTFPEMSDFWKLCSSSQ